MKEIQACGFTLIVTVNFYDDTLEPGELFVNIAKQGSTISGFVDALVTTISIALQHGVPWEVLRNKYVDHKFEPSDGVNPSLVHAIAVAVDNLIQVKKDLWDSDGTKNVP